MLIESRHTKVKLNIKIDLKFIEVLFLYWINSLNKLNTDENIHLEKCHDCFFYTEHNNNRFVYKNDKLDNCSTKYIFDKT